MRQQSSSFHHHMTLRSLRSPRSPRLHPFATFRRLAVLAFHGSAAFVLAACTDATAPSDASSRELAAAPEAAATFDLDSVVRDMRASQSRERVGAESARARPTGRPRVSPEISLGELAYGPQRGGQRSPKLVFGGGVYLAAWDDFPSGWDSSGLTVARVAEDGTVLDPGGISLSGFAFGTNIASDGTNFLAVWSPDELSFYGARVTPLGQVLDPGGFFIVSDESASWPNVSFDGSNYVLAWSHWGEEITHYVTRVSPSATVLDPAPIEVSAGATPSGLPSLASNGEGTLLVWQDHRSGNQDIYASRLSQEGTVLDPGGFPVTAAPANEQEPGVTFDGTNYTVTWKSGGIAAARVSPLGAVLDPAGIPVAGTGANARAAAFDGTNTIVIWNRQLSDWRQEVRATRVSPAGVNLDPAGVEINPNSLGYLALARGSTGLLAAWDEAPVPEDWAHVYGIRLNGAPAPVGAKLILSNKLAAKIEPGVAFDGQNYVVAWADERSAANGIYGVRVTPSGEVLDPTGIFVTNAHDLEQRAIAIFDGTNTVILFNTNAVEGGGGGLYAARLSPAGIALDPSAIPLGVWGDGDMSYSAASAGAGTVIVTDYGWYGDGFSVVQLSPDGSIVGPGATLSIARPGYHIKPTIHYDGAGYLMTWLNRDDAGVGVLYGSRMTPEGVLLDPAGVAISDVTAGGTVLAESVITRLGANRLVVWKESRGGVVSLYGAEVSPLGVVLSPHSISIGGIPTAQDGWRSLVRREYDAVNDGNQALIVWRDLQAPVGPSLLGTTVAPGGLAQPSFTVSAESGAEGTPRLASRGDGSSLAVFSRDDTSGTRQAKARFVSTSSCSYAPVGATPTAAPLALLALGAVLARRRRCSHR